MKIRLASPDIRLRDILRVASILRSGQLVSGARVSRAERSLAEYCGTDDAALVSSGTAALHLSGLATGIEPGDTVLVPAFSFPATANAFRSLGASIEFVDVDPMTYVMDEADMIRRANELIDQGTKPKAVVIVHEFGFPVALEALPSFCRDQEITLIEDAACALGSWAGGRHVGTLGDYGCFSFHPRKSITSGEGGMIVSKRQEGVDFAKSARNHGIVSFDDGSRDFVFVGLNYRLTEFQAQLLDCQFDRFRAGGAVERKQKLAQVYLNRLAGVKGLQLPEDHPGHSWQTFMVVLESGEERDALTGYLRTRGVESGPAAQTIPLCSSYKLEERQGRNDFPIAQRLSRNGLALPIHSRMKRSHALRVSRLVRDYLENHR